MDKKDFHYLDQDDEPIKQVEKSFFDSENPLTPKEVRGMADGIVAEIKKRTHGVLPDEKQAVIVNLLEENRIFKEAQKVDKSVTVEDISDPLKRIRNTVLEKLNDEMGDEVDVHMISKVIADWSAQVSVVNDNKITKRHVISVPSLAKAHDRAIDKLSTLRDEGKLHPNVAHSLIARGEEKGAEGELDEVHRRLNIVPLDELISGKNKPPLEKTFGYFIDGLKGMRFLLSEGLVLTNNSEDNIAVNKDNDSGVLFDLDGLLPSDEKITNMDFINISRLGYIPPERMDREDTSKRAIKEAEIVFEFGVSLRNIVRFYEKDNDVSILRTLAEEMTQADPNQRPRIASIIDRYLDS